MGYVFDFKDAIKYDQWVSQEKNRVVLDLERHLMLSMLRPVCGQSLLDIGCGTGASLIPFLNKGIELTGIEPSPYMLDFAHKHLGHRVDLHRGYAEDLPFADNSFNYSVLFLTLEFCDNPSRAIAEACRVTKDRLFIGILNKYSLSGIQRGIGRLLRVSIYEHARFFGIGEIRRQLYGLLGDVPVSWRTVLQLPGTPRGMAYRLESSRVSQRSPFGGFAGIAAEPVPRLRAVPLALMHKMNHKARSGEQVASCAGDYQNEQLKN